MSAALMNRKSKKYVCPVCGYLLSYPPQDFNICPSCGVEFGAETSVYSFEDLRRNWLQNGAQWSSRVQKKPRDWDPYSQLRDFQMMMITARLPVSNDAVRIIWTPGIQYDVQYGAA